MKSGTPALGAISRRSATCWPMSSGGSERSMTRLTPRPIRARASSAVPGWASTRSEVLQLKEDWSRIIPHDLLERRVLGVGIEDDQTEVFGHGQARSSSRAPPPERPPGFAGRAPAQAPQRGRVQFRLQAPWVPVCSRFPPHQHATNLRHYTGETDGVDFYCSNRSPKGIREYRIEQLPAAVFERQEADPDPFDPAAV